MRVLIVDDEPPARARLVRLLAAHADVQVVGEAEDAAAALAQVARLQPDVLLLDIRLPGTDGLDLAASLPDPRPVVVFVTAHADHALDAFDADARDYLLKPVAAERLARALQRLRARAPSLPRPAPDRLLIADREHLHVVPVADIRWLEAADNYVVVHTATRAPLLRRTLGGLLQDLGPAFVQTHRSAAVALAHVLRVEAGVGGDAVVHLDGALQVRCSRARRAELMARLAER